MGREEGGVGPCFWLRVWAGCRADGVRDAQDVVRISASEAEEGAGALCAVSGESARRVDMALCVGVCMTT